MKYDANDLEEKEPPIMDADTKVCTQPVVNSTDTTTLSKFITKRQRNRSVDSCLLDTPANETLSGNTSNNTKRNSVVSEIVAM